MAKVFSFGWVQYRKPSGRFWKSTDGQYLIKELKDSGKYELSTKIERIDKDTFDSLEEAQDYAEITASKVLKPSPVAELIADDLFDARAVDTLGRADILCRDEMGDFTISVVKDGSGYELQIDRGPAELNEMPVDFNSLDMAFQIDAWRALGLIKGRPWRLHPSEETAREEFWKVREKEETRKSQDKFMAYYGL